LWQEPPASGRKAQAVARKLIMQAIRVHGRENLRFESVPDPAPGPGEVMAAVRAVNVCATDLELYLQELAWYTSGWARLPIIPGHEWSGEIVEIGPGVEGFRVGDRVVGEVAIGCGHCPLCRAGHSNVCPSRAEVGIINHDGAFAERLVMPASLVHPIGDLEFEAAAFLEPTTVALWAAERGRIAPGDRVIVLGAGTIGLLAMQAARARGAASVTVTDLDDRPLALARELGADAAVNVGRREPEGRFDAVIEATGSPQAVEQALALAAPLARIVIAGTFAGRPAMVDLDTIVAGELTVCGIVGGPGKWQEAIELVTKGVIRTTPLISRRLPLAEAEQAFAIMRDPGAGVLRIQLKP
jgi:2-desacetyl-2-hydroxyethyl bacteriochlorophyllide A dehydrogenase